MMSKNIHPANSTYPILTRRLPIRMMIFIFIVNKERYLFGNKGITHTDYYPIQDKNHSLRHLFRSFPLFSGLFRPNWHFVMTPFRIFPDFS